MTTRPASCGTISRVAGLLPTVEPYTARAWTWVYAPVLPCNPPSFDHRPGCHRGLGAR